MPARQAVPKPVEAPSESTSESRLLRADPAERFKDRPGFVKAPSESAASSRALCPANPRPAAMSPLPLAASTAAKGNPPLTHHLGQGNRERRTAFARPAAEAPRHCANSALPPRRRGRSPARATRRASWVWPPGPATVAPPAGDPAGGNLAAARSNAALMPPGSRPGVSSFACAIRHLARCRACAQLQTSLVPCLPVLNSAQTLAGLAGRRMWELHRGNDPSQLASPSRAARRRSLGRVAVL